LDTNEIRHNDANHPGDCESDQIHTQPVYAGLARGGAASMDHTSIPYSLRKSYGYWANSPIRQRNYLVDQSPRS
jgi:hypothetical protein